MAEFYMSYDDIFSMINDSIMKSEDKAILEDYKAQIMTAVTSDCDEMEKDEIPKMVGLWNSVIKNQSQLVIGDRYIFIRDVVVALINVAISSGLIGTIISTGTFNLSVAITSTGSLVMALYEMFRKASTLDDDDFCVFYQIVENHRKYREFSEEDVISWFPHDEDNTCNIEEEECAHKWKCFFLREDNKCIIDKTTIHQSIKSLIEKGILGHSNNNNLKIVF